MFEHRARNNFQIVNERDQEGDPWAEESQRAAAANPSNSQVNSVVSGLSLSDINAANNALQAASAPLDGQMVSLDENRRPFRSIIQAAKENG